MPNFLENIFAQLKQADARVVLREIHGERFVGVTGRELLEMVGQVRAFLRSSGAQPGDRCALLASNSISWITVDLALMIDGVVVVPLYSRQTVTELAAMIKDCQPRLVLTDNPKLEQELAPAYPEIPALATFDEVFDAMRRGELPHSESKTVFATSMPARERLDSELLTIIYTSGTSGEAKGVCLTVGNVNHMIGCTTERLDQLMGQTSEPDQIFLYAPMNFAASWMLMLSAFSRESVITLSTDLNKLADEIRLSGPHYFLNVPTLLERVKRGVEGNIAKQAAPIRSLYARAIEAWQRSHAGRGTGLDRLWLFLGRKLIFAKVKRRFGPNLRALICGSAPLAPETQQWFLMLGILVLQAYGLTETTALCTLDDPRVPVEPGYVGRAVSGVEMKLAENDEIIVRGPNIFSGYWNRSEETAKVLRDGWFHTGDQGEVNARGNWRISGRIKNLIVLNSGHKIAPEPMEEKIARLLPAAQQVVIVGNGRGYLCALIAGTVEAAAVQAALDAVNRELPHYRQIRNFALIGNAFTPESGLLTGNGKLRRDAINERFASEINAMYEDRKEREAAGRQHA